jgi:hypothetical protein
MTETDDDGDTLAALNVVLDDARPATDAFCAQLEAEAPANLAALNAALDAARPATDAFFAGLPQATTALLVELDVLLAEHGDRADLAALLAQSSAPPD